MVPCLNLNQFDAAYRKDPSLDPCYLYCILMTWGAFITTFLARNDFRNDFQGDLGDDKRKAVLIMGLETPFRDAAFISTFSGVELRFPNDFRVIFADDKRKAVLIMGLETRFSNAEKRAIWNAFEPETRFCRGDTRKAVLKRV